MSSPEAQPAPPVRPRVAQLALMAGLTALVPLPLLDDWLERRAHRAMFHAVAEAEGTPLDDATLALLTEDRSSVVYGCLGMAVIWPIKKLFRTFFYFLTVKDVIDGAAQATLRAAMLRSALAHLPHDAKRVRDAMDATLDRHQYSPVSRWFFRGERPDAEWLADVDALDRAVAWIYRKSGGGAILPRFVERLTAPPPVAPVAPAAPAAPAAPPEAP